MVKAVADIIIKARELKVENEVLSEMDEAEVEVDGEKEEISE
jgi:small subunit ribosomal protein S2